MATHSRFVPGEPPGRTSLVGCGPRGHEESDTTDGSQHTQEPPCPSPRPLVMAAMASAWLMLGPLPRAGDNAKGTLGAQSPSQDPLGPLQPRHPRLASLPLPGKCAAGEGPCRGPFPRTLI